MSTTIRRWTVLTLVLSSLLPCQAARVEPVLKDVAYADDTPAQRLDVYRPDGPEARPVMVFIHGGGWRQGSKNHIPRFLATAVAEGWLAVVSVEYRFTDVAIHPAQVRDCVRAVQFIRRHAKEWNIDASRLGVTGGSAGGHLSLWVALHDDGASPSADDPVERESSRVSCGVSFAGPADWSLLAEIDHRHPAYRQLLGYTPDTPVADMKEDLKASVSPISYASADDPPTLLVHGDADNIVPIEHARRLETRLRACSVETELYVVKGAGHNVAGAGDPEAVRRATAFIRKHLGIPVKTQPSEPGQ